MTDLKNHKQGRKILLWKPVETGGGEGGGGGGGLAACSPPDLW